MTLRFLKPEQRTEHMLISAIKIDILVRTDNAILVIRHASLVMEMMLTHVSAVLIDTI